MKGGPMRRRKFRTYCVCYQKTFSGPLLPPERINGVEIGIRLIILITRWSAPHHHVLVLLDHIEPD